MNRVFAGLAAVALATTPLPALAQAPAPTTTVNLPVELKDPHHAYVLGMIPFGSHVASTYVGTNKFSWRTAGWAQKAANNQLLADVGLLSAGVASGFIASANPGVFDWVTLACALAIPASHILFYAPFWGEKAVDNNLSELQRNGFKIQAVGQ